jgi:hypothetical protein
MFLKLLKLMPLFAFVCVTGTAIADMPGAKSTKADAVATLKVLHVDRQLRHGCEPIAPIETRLVAPNSAVVGRQFGLRMEGMLTESGAPSTMRIDLPQGIRLVSGRSMDQGTMDKGKSYSWDFGLVVDRSDDFQVTVQIIAGNKDYEFGQRRTLYIDNVKGNLVLTTERPKVAPVLQQDPYPAQIVKESVPLSVYQRGTPPEAPFDDKIDPYGAELDPPSGNNTDAVVTINGTWRYRHTDATLHAGYGTWVEAWDEDTTSADDFLDRATADGVGAYTLSFDNADDIGFGTADVYLVFRSENTRVEVHNSGSTTGYSTATAVIWTNILGGTFTAPSYFADWGTNGISDSNERAFQLCDDVTTAWQHWNFYTGILFDNRKTFVQWYIGSTDGSYYLTAENRVFLEDSDVSSVDVTMHEYGHSLHDGLFDDIQWPPGTGGPHSFTGHYTTGLAWTEGFATYYSCTAQGNNWIYNSYDPGNLITFDCDSNWDGNSPANGNSDGLSNSPNWGYDTESAVLAFQLDLDDARNSTTDPFDWSTLGDDEIFQVMRNYTTGGHRPYSVQEFFDGWHANIDVQNPKINAQMHNHGMEQSISFEPLGLFNGVDRYTGTWYYGGYGRGSFDVKNYSSESYDINQCYVWLRGPAGEDIGHFGGDGNGAPLTSGEERNVWEFRDQTGYNPGAPNFIYGLYTITAGFYRSDNVFQVCEVAETGADNQISVNVIEDTTGPPSCAVQDDGDHQVSLTTVHITAQSSEPHSSIQGYWTRVGSTAGTGNYQDWVLHPANNVTNWDYTITGLAIPAGSMVFVTVVSQNIESVDSPFAYTDGIRCGDTTPPGPVTVTDDGQFAPRNDSIHYLTSTTEPDGGIFQWWSRVGTSPGLGNVQDWVNYPVHTLSFDNTITPISMPTGSMYYITSVARNYGLQDTFGNSNGILSPLFPTFIAVSAGQLFGGSFASLAYDDSNRLIVFLDEFDPNAELLIIATCPVATGSAIHSYVQTSASRNDLVQFLDGYNFDTASWVQLQAWLTTFGDTNRIVNAGNANPFINNANMGVQSRIRSIPSVDIDAADGWTFSIDRFNWYVAP